jgi:hypothetical protein
LTVKGVNGVGLALLVGVTAGRLGNATGAAVPAPTAAVGVAVGVILLADFEQPASARAINKQTRALFNMGSPFFEEKSDIFILQRARTKLLLIKLQVVFNVSG